MLILPTLNLAGSFHQIGLEWNGQVFEIYGRSLRKLSKRFEGVKG